ncbi:MAG: preprotein translocase subunit SecG [Hyphomicrobiales bacterium]|nr:MAG: preprotein translocase subunit SecG [Hyphomicrobiales bacterium]
MENVILVAYLLIVLALIAVILLQRSEGGGLGMGGNAGGLMTVRGSANLLTRTTAVLAALFFVTAIGLTLLAQFNRDTDSILDGAATPNGSTPATVLDALTQMQGDTTLPLPAASTSAPAAASEAAPTDPGLALPVPDTAPSEAANSAASSAPAP